MPDFDDPQPCALCEAKVDYYERVKGEYCPNEVFCSTYCRMIFEDEARDMDETHEELSRSYHFI